MAEEGEGDEDDDAMVETLEEEDLKILKWKEKEEGCDDKNDLVVVVVVVVMMIVLKINRLIFPSLPASFRRLYFPVTFYSMDR